MIPSVVRENRRIILVDGLCNLCSGLVRFVARNDTGNLFKFVWAQGEEGGKILEWCGLDKDSMGTMVYVEDGKAYLKSTGILKIIRYLRSPWHILSATSVIPLFIRDGVYDVISRNRTKIFGARSDCPLPGEKLKDRFL